MLLKKSIFYTKKSRKTLPYLFFIHMSGSSLTLKKKHNIDPLKLFTKWFSGFFSIFVFVFGFFFATLYKVVVVCFPYPPRIPIWVVWVSIFCHVFKECFLCDIFIGGNRIFCVKFPLFGLCNRRCFDFWLRSDWF